MITRLEHYFCEEVLTAITEYEANFRPAHKTWDSLTDEERRLPIMTAKRSSDVNSLRQLVSLPPNQELAAYLKAVNAQLKKMRTGWFFIRTNRSRLKTNVTSVLSRYQKPETIYYIRRIAELEQEKTLLETECQRLRQRANQISQQQRHLADVMQVPLTIDEPVLTQASSLSASVSSTLTTASEPKSARRWFGLFERKSKRKDTTYSLHTLEQEEAISLLLPQPDDNSRIYSTSFHSAL